MIKVYTDNGLPFYDDTWLRDRRYAATVLRDTMETVLSEANPAWQMCEIEAPALMPQNMLNPEYGQEDVYYGTPHDQLVLRPETTASSYAYAQYLLEHQQAKPPLCVYQAGRSYRRENDQVAKNVRLKEFYQMEFQCIVTEDTKMDYQDDTVTDPLANAVKSLVGQAVRIVPSDRLPNYSDKTLDLEVATEWTGNDVTKWLEVASISKRHDVPFEWCAGEASKAGHNMKKLINYEFAFGLDRIVHAMRAA